MSCIMSCLPCGKNDKQEEALANTIGKDIMQNPDSCPIFCYDRIDYKIVLCNVASEKLFGINEQKLLNERFDHLFLRDSDSFCTYKIKSDSELAKKVDSVSVYTFDLIAGPYRVVVCFDVNKKKQSEKQSEHATDSSTPIGLENVVLESNEKMSASINSSQEGGNKEEKTATTQGKYHVLPITSQKHDPLSLSREALCDKIGEELIQNQDSCPILCFNRSNLLILLSNRATELILGLKKELILNLPFDLVFPRKLSNPVYKVNSRFTKKVDRVSSYAFNAQRGLYKIVLLKKITHKVKSQKNNHSKSSKHSYTRKRNQVCDEQQQQNQLINSFKSILKNSLNNNENESGSARHSRQSSVILPSDFMNVLAGQKNDDVHTKTKKENTYEDEKKQNESYHQNNSQLMSSSRKRQTNNK